jgi:hypothetical protein
MVVGGCWPIEERQGRGGGWSEVMEGEREEVLEVS